MGKSSSSRKKRSKNTSQSRSRKRGRSESKRYKSTGPHRRNDSIFSDGDDYDTMTSVSESSYSSEDDFKSHRSRSRVRKTVKSGKKRNRRRSSSSESSQETSPSRRRKRSKKKGSFEARNKSQKKKFRRDQSALSMNSGSCSCSDCQCESEIERHRGKSKKKEKNKRKLGRMKGGSKRKRYRSRSSTCSVSSRSRYYQDEENLTTENNSLRLRSVITFPKEDREGREFDKIGHNEEMVYDRNDYPSCKSSDSNNGGSKKDLLRPSSAESEKENAIDDGKIEETIVSSNETFVATGSTKDNEAHHFRSIQSPDRTGTTDDAVKETNNEAQNSNGNGSAVDLEYVLRQRALENLKKFRGGIQTNAKTPVDEKIRSISIPIPKACQMKSPGDQGTKVKAAMESAARGSANVLQRDTALSSQIEEKNSYRFNAGNESGSAKQDATLVTDPTIERASGTASAVTNKPKLTTLALRKVSSNVIGPPKRVNVLGNPHDEKIVIKSGADKGAAETAPAVKIQGGKNNSDTFSEASGSALVLPSPSLEPEVGNVSSNNLPEQTKEGSQLERKTMSVMRGGEMVEVSYKVYIPKKAPALARRPLKR